MLKVWCSWNKVIVTYVNNWNGLSSYLVQYSTKLPQCYQPYTCFVRPYSSVILFFTPVKYRISVVTRFEHICHSSWEICDRSRFFFIYHEITFFTGQKVHDIFNKKECFTNESYLSQISTTRAFTKYVPFFKRAFRHMFFSNNTLNSIKPCSDYVPLILLLLFPLWFYFL